MDSSVLSAHVCSAQTHQLLYLTRAPVVASDQVCEVGGGAQKAASSSTNVYQRAAHAPPSRVRSTSSTIPSHAMKKSAGNSKYAPDRAGGGRGRLR